MRLWEAEGNKVMFTFLDGSTMVGTPKQYTSPLDNEPNGACIYVDDLEILESEILKIELA